MEINVHILIFIKEGKILHNFFSVLSIFNNFFMFQ